MKALKTPKKIKGAKEALKVKTLLISNLGSVAGGGCSCYRHLAW